MTDRPYIDLLRDDLADYARRTARAREQLTLDEDSDFYRMVLAQLERGKAIVEARIAAELQKAPQP